jgi:hypothetical protein
MSTQRLVRPDKSECLKQAERKGPRAPGDVVETHEQPTGMPPQSGENPVIGVWEDMRGSGGMKLRETAANASDMG